MNGMISLDVVPQAGPAAPGGQPPGGEASCGGEGGGQGREG